MISKHLNNTAKIAKCLFPVLMLASMGRDGFAQTPESRALVHGLPYNYALGDMFANPVLKPYEHGESFSSVEAGWDGSADGCRGVFDASAYMPLKGTGADATVWGDASYANGWQRPDGIIESADYEIVRPYALADTVGGRMSAERYAFGGGYATRGRLAWGVSGSYVASLSYRDCDPRPRNVCGTLDIAVGGALRMGRQYVVAAGASLWRYRQSSSIMFMSELGEPAVYHLTGLGNVYARFNSLGKSTHYSALGGSAGVSLLPGRRAGAFASFEGGVFSMDYVLKDLNNLPVAHLKLLSLSARAGWRSDPGRDYVSASAFATHIGRRGTENIFGDATAGIYPQIASLQLYNRRQSSAGIDIAGVKYLADRHVVSLTATAAFVSESEEYESPARRLASDCRQLSVRPSYAMLSGRWLLGCSAGYMLTDPYDCKASGFAGVDTPMVRDALARWHRATETLHTASAEIVAIRGITGRIAVKLGVSGKTNAAGSALTVRAGVVF